MSLEDDLRTVWTALAKEDRPDTPVLVAFSRIEKALDLSPTQETDPRPDPLPYGYNRFMTARNEANEPDPFERPTQETDPE